jgi:hypothetical protein
MQVLIAYGLEREPADGETAAGLARVAAHYERLWTVPVTRQGNDAGRVGLHVWDATDAPSRWPLWQQEPSIAVGSLYYPLGYEQVVGSVPVERAALPLARALLERPERVSDLTPPFVIGAFEPEAGRITLVTDALGVGRLYQLRFPGGWVWSNRPAAACLFSGVRAEADITGWRTFAATGWFMGDHTPFQRVHAVPAGTQVGFDAAGPGRIERRVDCLAGLAANRRGDALTADRIDDVAEALQDLARSVPRMWVGDIVVSLSGGRDSRLVAAAFLSAGVDLELYTNGAEAGEATTARELVAALPVPVHHRVDSGAWTEASAGRPVTLERALAWHRLQEGLRMATYVSTRPPDGLGYSEHIGVSGGAGEIAHGHYYPWDIAELVALPYGERIESICERLVSRVVRRSGISHAARDAAAWQVRRVILSATTAGMDDAKVLDYFYAAERVRRWGTTAEGTGVVSPLLAPEFMRAAFDLTAQQRGENALHRAVTERLMPVWKDTPYYRRPVDEVVPALRPRLSLAQDHELIGAVVGDPGSWGDQFDPGAVQREWQRLRSGVSRPQGEALLQRVIWRAVFDDYLAELNGEQRPTRTPVAEVRRRRTRPFERQRRFAARALCHVARLINDV